MRKKIAIVAGGYSSESGVSLKSAQGLLSFIDRERYEVYVVLIAKDRWFVQTDDKTEIPIDKNDFSFIQAGQKVYFDFAYITIHGTPGENGLLQGYFDMMGIPYSSCGVLASALSFNKYFCNQFLKNFGVKTAEFIFLRKGDPWDSTTIQSKLGLPVFVKPNDSGSSYGVTKVNSADKLQAAIYEAFNEGTEVLVERFLPGTEVTCGCYKIKDKTTVFPITEVVSKNEFFDFDAKYNPNNAEEITPARISDRLTQEIQTLTSNIYNWIGAKGIIRIDYIISPEGEISMLEVNATPGMTATSFIPQQIKAAGLNILDVFTEIIESTPQPPKGGAALQPPEGGVAPQPPKGGVGCPKSPLGDLGVSGDLGVAIFDDIRPYYNDEAAPVIERLLDNPQFCAVLNYLFQGDKHKQVVQLMKSISNQRDFQHLIIKEFVFELLKRASSTAELTGLENVSKTTAYTYISNHRDIVLDVAILCSLLAEKGYETVEIAIGDNLLMSDWIKDMVRLNKSFLVKRSVTGRQMLEAAIHLSKYIHYTIGDKNQSIWIAQREGRAKDSNDRTQESVLKMLSMGGNKNFLKSLMEINLIPLTFSYEYDPCDYLKAKEFQQKRDNPDFKKSQADDLLNMKTGLFGYKGRIHLQVGKPINPALEKLDDSLRRNELTTQVASIIDKAIFMNYKFFPINYIAYDRLWGNNFFGDKYSKEDAVNVENYFQKQLDKIDLPDKDIPYLMERIEEMYANPLKNFLEL